MKRLHAAFSCLLLFFAGMVTGQDFSNKGTDFWVGYGLHSRMLAGANGGSQDMVLYFATEAVTNITVSIPGVGYSQTYTNIPANSIFTTAPLPKIGSQDSRLFQEGVSNKGIHITATKPVVAYSHIYNTSVSGATLLFPTNTLGKDYYSINFEQHSNEGNSNAFFYAVATDTGTTTIEVIPSANTQTMVAGQTYLFNLSQGQIFNALGTISGNDGVDLTGSRIRSIGTGSGGCKRIAVFSGSGKLNIKCPPGASGNSADNYMVQAFPKNAWGKNYLTVPTSQMPANLFRIAVQDPTTVVKLNGTVLTGLIGNFYYQISQNSLPNLIEADKPVMVAQYITSANQCGNTSIGNDGDPEVIYLSPIEQNIGQVIINSTPNYGINRHYVNVVIPNSGTAISSFRIDGAVPSASFVTHPRNPAYSYLVQNLSAGQHTLKSDSGFNALAYGYGPAESYGYNAGTNVKDLYQFVSIQNQYATVNFPATCKNTPFFFSMTFPYQPTQIKWVFGTALNSMGINDATVSSPVADSTWFVNGKQLYRYKLPGTYFITAIGTYAIKVLAQNPTPDGCSGEQEINYDLQVGDRPTADFTFTSTGCVTDTVRFTDNSNTSGRPTIFRKWDFDDGQLAQVAGGNTVHLYGTAKTYNPKLFVVTDYGCVSDTVSKSITLSDPPVAKFGVAMPFCAGKTMTFTDSSFSANSVLVKWTWSFGDGTAPVVALAGTSQTHTYAAAGTYTVTLLVESASGCRSLLFQKSIKVSPVPVAGFTFGKACLPAGTVQFTDASTISDGTQNTFIYVWSFGDGGSAATKNPGHSYAAVGPYSVSLIVTSGAGCVDSVQKTVDSVYAQPQAVFNAPVEVCFGTLAGLTDQSAAPASTVSQWLWDFGDGSPSASQQNPTHNYAAPGTYSISLTVKSSVGCSSATTTKQIVVNPLPTADFSSSVPSCVNRSLTFTDKSAANAGTLTKWTWNFGDGSAQVVAATGVAQTHTYATTGSYKVTLLVETDKGCNSAVTSKFVAVYPVPVPGFVMPGNCINDPVTQFTDTSSIADGTQNQFSYGWNFGDANATPANPNTSAVKDPLHKFTATGNYSVTLTVTSNNGCIDSITQIFTINGAVPISRFTVLDGLQACSNDTIRIADNSSVFPGRIVRLEIYWDYTANPTNKQTVNNPVPGAVYSTKYPEFFSPTTKNYDIRMIAYSGINCLNTSQQSIVMKATPDIAFPAINSVCADEPPFQLQANALNMTGGNGTFSGRGVSATGIFSPAAAGAGKQTIRYTYTAANECLNFKEQTITVFPVPTVDAGPDRFVLEGGAATFSTAASGVGLTYLWSPATYLSNPSIATPVTRPVDDINYTFTATSADGCSASDNVFVKVLKAPLVPNVFSPNGDGVNDRWEIKYLESYPGATVEIYNRYGQKVFESKGYTRPWDGTYQGSGLPAGTYYYIINPKNGRQQMAGYVDIIR